MVLDILTKFHQVQDNKSQFFDILWPNSVFKAFGTFFCHHTKKWLIFSKFTYFGAKRQKKSNKALKLIWAIFGHSMAKKDFYGPIPNKIWSKYLKPCYFDIVEVVKHFSQGLGRRSDYGQNSKNSQKLPKNGQHPKMKKISNKI